MELSWNVPATWETNKQKNKKPILANELAIKTRFNQQTSGHCKKKWSDAP